MVRERLGTQKNVSEATAKNSAGLVAAYGRSGGRSSPCRSASNTGVHTSSRLAGGAGGEGRRTVDEVVEHVELVRELVVHDVLAVFGVPSILVDLVPGEQDRPPAIVRLAEHGHVAVAHRSGDRAGPHAAETIVVVYTMMLATSR